jgi:hypothetical protein
VICVSINLIACSSCMTPMMVSVFGKRPLMPVALKVLSKAPTMISTKTGKELLKNRVKLVQLTENKNHLVRLILFSFMRDQIATLRIRHLASILNKESEDVHLSAFKLWAVISSCLILTMVSVCGKRCLVQLALKVLSKAPTMTFIK